VNAIILYWQLCIAFDALSLNEVFLKLQDELNFSTTINTPALFESITIYVSNLEYLAAMIGIDFIADVFILIENSSRCR